MKSLKFDVIVIGASMGGFQALKKIISELPKKLAAAVLVVLHIPGDEESHLADLYAKNSKIPVHAAVDGALIKSGHVYVAVPDHHLRVKDHHIVLDKKPKDHFHRPSVDALFSSAAEDYGTHAIGVILTGALDDGTKGLMEIKRLGGVSVIQDPKDADTPSMPSSALAAVEIDHCVHLDQMSALLTKLVGGA
jgi:two-component system chemotaxis response regulator CheB